MGGKLLDGQMVGRGEAAILADEVTQELGEYIHRSMICGSYRRGKEELGDVDIVVEVKQENRLRFNLELQQRFGCEWQLTRKSFLYKGVQVELYVTMPEGWGAMLLHATGKAGYNACIRKLAAERGYKLNQYGLWSGLIRIAGLTEESVYKTLGIGFKRPEDRS